MKPLFNEVKKDNKNKKIVGVEIGVHGGDNAVDILKELDFSKLYLIDEYVPYSSFPDGVGKPSCKYWRSPVRLKEEMKPSGCSSKIFLTVNGSQK